MTAEEIKRIVACGETSTVQFKQQWTTQKEMAKEMVAFANTRGGIIVFGINDKNGNISGLTYEQVQTISRELGNTANEQVRPTIYIDTDVVTVDDKHVLVCSIANGNNKPYKTLTSEIWVKQGADKRHLTENFEILSLFQESGNYQADTVAVEDSCFDDIDRHDLDDYMKKVYGNDLSGFGDNWKRVLRNIHVLKPDGRLTLCGYLFFCKNPEFQCPTCMIKAVSFYGNNLGDSQYLDSKEITGNIPRQYEQAIMFLKSNLHSMQESDRSFNSLGKLEISEEILEEAVQNAIIHRDLLRPAPIRILVFKNRVEIISPGALAGGLTVDDIRNGMTYQRNPWMAVFATNALHYHGIGSGIMRMMQQRDDIILENDENGKEFKIIIPRVVVNDTQKPVNDTQKPTNDTQKPTNDTQKPVNDTQKPTNDTQKPVNDTQNIEQSIENYIAENNAISTNAIASFLGVSVITVKRKLKELGYRWEGASKSGKWIKDNKHK